MSQREPGSVIEERLFFAHEVEQGVALGHTARTCDTCGKPWLGPQVCGQGTCRGMVFTDRAVHVTPMVIESMPAPNRANATSLLPRTVKVEVQSEEDIKALYRIRFQLEKTIEEMGGVDRIMHRILSRSGVDMAALFQEAKTPREIAERDERMADVNREIWFDLQSTIHFAAEQLGDTPLGGSVPFNASLVLQCKHVIGEIDRAIQKYGEALKK